MSDSVTGIYLQMSVALNFFIVTLCCFGCKQSDPAGSVDLLDTLCCQSATVKK